MIVEQRNDSQSCSGEDISKARWIEFLDPGRHLQCTWAIFFQGHSQSLPWLLAGTAKSFWGSLSTFCW